MKTKILMSVLAIGMAIALIGGATMAWFTAEDEVPEQQFTAGTVEVDAQNPSVTPMEEKSIRNVNPGDCATITWNIVNVGTKAAQFRVKLTEDWLNADLSTENVFYAPAEGSGWVMYEQNKGIWLYYIGEPDDGVPGTFGNTPKDNRTIPLELIVAFDGALTDDDYQGELFKLDGVVEAIQASNGAPSAVWKDAWDTVTGEYGYGDYKGLAKKYINYFLIGPGNDMPCWTGGNGGGPSQPDDYTVNVIIEDQGYGTVSGTGSYKPGAHVSLAATPEVEYEFDRWVVDGVEDYTEDGANLSFTMPENDVNVTAVFKEVGEPQLPVIDFDVKDLKVSAENKWHLNNKYTKVTITGKVRNYKIDDVQYNVTKEIKGFVDIEGFKDYSGEINKYIGNGWSSRFTITYNIPGRHEDDIDDEDDKVRIEIDGVVKPQQ